MAFEDVATKMSEDYSSFFSLLFRTPKDAEAFMERLSLPLQPPSEARPRIACVGCPSMRKDAGTVAVVAIAGEMTSDEAAGVVRLYQEFGPMTGSIMISPSLGALANRSGNLTETRPEPGKGERHKAEGDLISGDGCSEIIAKGEVWRLVDETDAPGQVRAVWDLIPRLGGGGDKPLLDRVAKWHSAMMYSAYTLQPTEAHTCLDFWERMGDIALRLVPSGASPDLRTRQSAAFCFLCGLRGSDKLSKPAGTGTVQPMLRVSRKFQSCISPEVDAAWRAQRSQLTYWERIIDNVSRSRVSGPLGCFGILSAFSMFLLAIFMGGLDATGLFFGFGACGVALSWILWRWMNVSSRVTDRRDAIHNKMASSIRSQVDEWEAGSAARALETERLRAGHAGRKAVDQGVHVAASIESSGEEFEGLTAPPLGRKACRRCGEVSFDQVHRCPNCGLQNWWEEAAASPVGVRPSDAQVPAMTAETSGDRATCESEGGGTRAAEAEAKRKALEEAERKAAEEKNRRAAEEAKQKAAEEKNRTAQVEDFDSEAAERAIEAFFAPGGGMEKVRKQFSGQGGRLAGSETAPSRTPDLLRAIKENDSAAVTALIGSGLKPTAGDDNGLMALHWAKSREMVAVLVNAGADIEARTHRGNTPLYVAVESGNLQAAEALLDSGADVHATCEHQRTALHMAAFNAAGNPPELGGAKEGLQIVRLLIERGADRGAIDDGGRTALAVAKGVTTLGIPAYPELLRTLQ